MCWLDVVNQRKLFTVSYSWDLLKGQEIDRSSCVLLWQYFLQFAADGINKQIEEAILKADRLGVKVISLAALNKVGLGSNHALL